MSTIEPLDAPLLQALADASKLVEETEVLQAMMQYDKSEYTRFITSEVENPKFKFTHPSFDKGTAADAIQACRDTIEASQAPEVVLQLYRAKLRNQELRFQMLHAVTIQDDQRFTELSQQLYGKPDKQRFAQIVHSIFAMTPRTTVAVQAHTQLLDELGHVAPPQAPLPTDVLLAPVVDTGPTLSARAVAAIFEETLQAAALDDWVVRIDNSQRRTRFSVNGYQRVVHVPADEHLAARLHPLNETAVRALAAHEIGVHAKRADAGRNQPLRLLAIGLDGYLPGEEGLAGYVQQQIEGATTFYGQDRYLAIALALGLDGTMRDFRAVFSLMLRYYQLMESDTEESRSQTIRQAWNVCQRIFRGTTGQTTGAVLTRDLAYFEGNIGIWDYIIAHPERYEYLFIGKYNPLNTRHVTSLQTLEILPQW